MSFECVTFTVELLLSGRTIAWLMLIALTLVLPLSARRVIVPLSILRRQGTAAPSVINDAF
jgi:hypothetical protein